jgi:hypothetical protein
MAVYNTNLWTGQSAHSIDTSNNVGLHITGVFPNASCDGDTVEFVAACFDRAGDLNNNEIHGCTAEEARFDVRKFIWGILEQTYVAYTGGRSADVTVGATTLQNDPAKTDETGSGEGKVAKMTVNKSSLALVDEDTAKTTYTITFNYSVDTPGASNLEVASE